MRLYNTRAGSVETIEVADVPRVGVYVCGPTVYSRVHIGNLRTFVMSDLVVSVLRAEIEENGGPEVKAVMNITDIDDKIVAALVSKGKTTFGDLEHFTTEHAGSFQKDLASLRVDEFELHRVTDHVDEMFEEIDKLIRNGRTYFVQDGSIYFDSSTVVEYPFPSFCKPDETQPDSQADAERTDTQTDTRTETRREIKRPAGVRCPLDFALWKAVDRNHLFWERPPTFVKGSFGWHIECSTIARKQLGEVLLHMGGEDLAFPHHTCEVLQYESIYPDQTFGRYWVHHKFLNMENDKMSKSIGNTVSLDDVGVSPMVLRYYFLTKSYRKEFEYRASELKKAKKSFDKLHLFYNRMRIASGSISSLAEVGNVDPDSATTASSIDLYREVSSRLRDDLDSAGALELIDEFVDRHRDAKVGFEIILDQLERVDRVLKVLDRRVLLALPEDEEEYNRALALFARRDAARTARRFEEADAVRAEIAASFFVEDFRGGFSFVRKT